MSTLTKKVKERLALPFLFVPTQKDIDNCEELSYRLKGNSIKETVTNILEYRECIKYWNERNYYSIIFLIFIFSTILYVATPIILNSIILIDMGICIAVLSCFFLRYKWMGWSFFYYSLLPVPMPVNKILNYKLAICCDYAKLTASLRFHFPEFEKIYFIRRRSHVAVGINIKSEGGDEIFVFDQRLPISTLNDWMQKWMSGADVYISENKNGKVTFDYVDTKKYIKRNSEPKIDIEKLTAEITELMRIDGNKASTFKLGQCPRIDRLIYIV
jgi:predicted transglutaminase-like protease